jgi:hypothetical protein
MKSRRSRENSVKREASKVRVRSVNWWQACKYVKLVPQITWCKRHSCTCSHLEYSLDSRVISECKRPSSPYKMGLVGTCKGIHNFWGENRLSEIPCLHALTYFRVLIRKFCSTCVRGPLPIFWPPNRVGGRVWRAWGLFLYEGGAVGCVSVVGSLCWWGSLFAVRFERSAQQWFLFAVRHVENARQTICLSCVSLKSARQIIFLQFPKIHKNYQIIFLKKL